MAAFVDTNVVVYAYDRADEVKRQLARSILADVAEPLVVSTQVLAEFYWVATRKLSAPLSEAEAAEGVAALAELVVVSTDSELVVTAIELARAHQIASWDALIVRAAQRAGCERLLSEDLQDGAEFGSVQVENPFAA
ncbi:MAG: PIN domain-containing protein [Thermoleophilaceae bacterium]